ncbi:hypothetical protein H0E87_021400 [Populus deltoides]|uniref:Uncharacterized protein n=1 Tax=Populus deltoides TaxID=3696 RepID=A0A8T2XHD9_POPDE|nr:hypothetical protein H0E87_021400 [Populus deltoides]
MSSERTDITREPTFPETAGHDSACNVRHRVQETQCMVMIQLISFLKMKTILNCLVRLWGLYEEQISQAVKIDTRKGQTCSDIQNTIGAQEKGQGTTGVVQVPVNSEVVANSTGKDPKQLVLDKTLGFNPIRQRRLFCTWIVSTSSGPPGWQQTLSALERQKEFSLPSTNSPPSSSLIKVDDPIASVRKLFMSPVERTKPTSGSS